MISHVSIHLSTYIIVVANVVINGAGNAVAFVAQVQDLSQQLRNVYYVHPSDGSSSVSVTPVLTHSNYHAWEGSMRCTLGGKNKFDIVDGSILVLVEFDQSFKAWS